jgi:competence ComEA-like helix-hairpin-helix protein
MNSKARKSLVFSGGSALLVFASLLASPGRAADFPDGPGKDVLLKTCNVCHGTEQIASKNKSEADWRSTVVRMSQHGAKGSSEELEGIVTYLAKNFGKKEDPTKVNVNTATAKDLETRLDLTSKESEAIVAFRAAHGNFREWGDLLVIYGVPGEKIEALQDKMSF